MTKLRIFTSYYKYSLPVGTKKIFQKILAIVAKNNSYLVSLSLVGKRKSQQLNSQYRQVNKPTDVLAFPFYHFYKKELTFTEEIASDLGDLFICYPLVKKQAQDNQHSFEKEICFLFLHGLLHLLGYDHETKSEREKMFTQQDKILRKVGITLDKKK